MGEGYHFVCPGEDHIMVTDDGAASDRADANFFLRSLLSAVAAVIDIFILTAKFFVDGISQCQCGAAGSVYLQIVVLLHNLHIEACVGQHSGSFFQKL